MIKHHIVYNPATNWRFDLQKAQDSFLWDSSGKKYIDFSSGWNVTNLGWNNKEIQEAIIKQAKINVYAPMWTTDETQLAYADELLSVFPESLDAVCRTTGGTESNEVALKIARAVTGRQKIVSFSHSYHGQSFGTLSLGYIPEYVKRIAPMVPEFIQLEYPNAFTKGKKPEEVLAEFLLSLETVLKTETVAALFTESGLITGWGSMLVAPSGYLSAVRELTKKYGTLLIIDEVGTGFSRTGKLFGFEHENVVPDIVTLAKGISNGAAPIGAVVTNAALVEPYIGAFKPTSTFGWTPLSCAVARKTLEIHTRDMVWEEAARKGELAVSILQKELGNTENVSQIRGKGLEIAFQVVDKKMEDLGKKLFAHGLHIADAGDCIQVMPPLTISDKLLLEGLEILTGVIKNL